MIHRLIVRLTARRWNRIASAILCRAHERNEIDSRTLHILAREFDHTQDGRVRTEIRGRRKEPYSLRAAGGGE